MNNKGQSLVLFVLVLPIMVGVMALVIDVGMVLHQKQEQESVIEMSLRYSLEEENIEKEKVESLVQNNLEDAEIEVIVENEKINVVVTEKVDGIFSRLLGFKKFQIISRYQGYIKDGKQKIEKQS